MIRRAIRNDVYRPHTVVELSGLVREGLLSPGVLASLGSDPSMRHGVWFYNVERVATSYRGDKKRRFTKKPRSEWIAVPVPDPGIPAETVDAARLRIKDNRWLPSNGGRELSGLIFCECGKPATTNTKQGGRYRYYVCGSYLRDGRRACEHGKHHPAEALEERVRAFVLSLLDNPETLKAKVLEQLEQERAASHAVEWEAKALLSRIEEAENERDGYLRLAAMGRITDAELDRYLSESAARGGAARGKLDALRERRRHADEIEEYAALLDEYLEDLPCLIGLERTVREYETVPAERTEDNPLGAYRLTPENVRFLGEEELAQRRRAAGKETAARFRWAYEALSLRVTVRRDGTLEVRWSFGERALPRTEPTRTCRPDGSPGATPSA